MFGHLKKPQSCNNSFWLQILKTYTKDFTILSPVLSSDDFSRITLALYRLFKVSSVHCFNQFFLLFLVVCYNLSLNPITYQYFLSTYQENSSMLATVGAQT